MLGVAIPIMDNARLASPRILPMANEPSASPETASAVQLPYASPSINPPIGPVALYLFASYYQSADL